MTPLVLLVLAAVLAVPAPALLARATPVRRAPRAALVLWQALALAGVLAALGAGLSLATTTYDGPAGPLVSAVALVLTAAVLVRLLVSGHRVGTRVRALRRRQRELVDLLAAEASGGGSVRVLEHEAPAVYCVPALARSRVVVTSGARACLDGPELEAVLLHERAHLRARHDLVVEAFTVLHEAVPRLTTGPGTAMSRISQGALAEVRLLVEALADRAARRRVGPEPLVRALATLVGAAAPEGGLAAGPGGSGAAGEVLARVTLLRDPHPHRLLAGLLYAAAAAVVGLPTVLVALPWLVSLPWPAG